MHRNMALLRKVNIDHLYGPRRDRIPQLTIKVMIRQRLKQEEIEYDSKCETFELKKYFMAKPGNRNAMTQYIHICSPVGPS